MRKEIASFQVSNKDLLTYLSNAFPPDAKNILLQANTIEFIKKGDNFIVSFLEVDKNGDFLFDGHLGGCSKNGDPATWTPGVWDRLIENLNVKSVIDVGCGYGHSTKYFLEKVESVLGIEGSQDAVDASLVREHIQVHDYSNSTFVPSEVFDLAWCCEFVEHVEEKFRQNFLDTFKRAKYVAMTYAFPGQGGHHHVNEQPESYWLETMKQNGFELMRDMTSELRGVAFNDGKVHNPEYNDNHFAHRGLLFKNVGL